MRDAFVADRHASFGGSQLKTTAVLVPHKYLALQSQHACQQCNHLSSGSATQLQKDAAVPEAVQPAFAFVVLQSPADLDDIVWLP